MVAYRVTSLGVFREYKSELFEGWVRVKFPITYEPEDKIFFADEKDKAGEEGVKMTCPKMPMSLFQQALEFMRYASPREAMVMFTLRNGEWGAVVPEQWTSQSSLCYHPELHSTEMSGVMADVHSHPPQLSISSTHSGTDDLDERKMDGIYVVVSGFYVATCQPNIRGVAEGSSFTIDPRDFFDLSKIDVNPTFPESWKDRLHAFPCDECKRKREAAEDAKKKAEEMIKVEEEVKYRLVTSSKLKTWRDACNEPTYGEYIASSYDDWRKETKYTGRVFQCDNYTCGKYLDDVICPSCNRKIFPSHIVKRVGDMVDEIELIELARKNPELVQKTVEEYKQRLEEELKKKEDEKAKDEETKRYYPDSTGYSHATDTEDKVSVASGAETCDPSCKLAVARFPHYHVSRESLMIDNPWD